MLRWWWRWYRDDCHRTVRDHIRQYYLVVTKRDRGYTEVGSDNIGIPLVYNVNLQQNGTFWLGMHRVESIGTPQWFKGTVNLARETATIRLCNSFHPPTVYVACFRLIFADKLSIRCIFIGTDENILWYPFESSNQKIGLAIWTTDTVVRYDTNSYYDQQAAPYSSSISASTISTIGWCSGGHA